VVVGEDANNGKKPVRSSEGAEVGKVCWAVNEERGTRKDKASKKPSRVNCFMNNGLFESRVEKQRLIFIFKTYKVLKTL